ncbi:MAG TPA: hypothetical protein ENF21_00495 [Bacteroidetes bacterium]|nr:hypothetical protein [Bacteroidota bacterium]
MILLNLKSMCTRKGLSVTFLIVFLCLPLYPQTQETDYYNLQNTLKFSDFLIRTRQYELAAQELERAAFLAPGNRGVQLKLLKTYRLGKQYHQSISTVERLYMNRLMEMPAEFGKEYLRSLILSGDYDRADYFIGTAGNLEQADRNNYTLSILLLKRNWEEARAFAAENLPVNMRLAGIAGESESIRYKSAGLALAMSAIVPGSGKIYTGKWKDGLISLVFVAANAYQAYRGFNKHGIESVHGWVFCTLATGFYAGNVYGSYKSARIYNNRLDEALQQKALDTFRSGL